MAGKWLRLSFTFQHPQDVEKYGDQPYVYDERVIVAMGGRDLVELEKDLGMRVVEMMNGVREDSAEGNLAATWWSVRQSGRAVPAFDEFNAHIMQLEWAAAPADDRGKDHEPEPLPIPDPALTVTLPSLPAVD